MAEENQMAIDLFGNLSKVGDRRVGRPSFEWSFEKSNKIKLLLALGWGNERIAKAMDISPATLKRYFRAELKVRDEMRDRLDAQRFDVTAQLAFDGNVSAMKELGKMIERNDLMSLGRRIDEKQSKPKTAPAVQVGKKEQALIDAADAADGTDWGGDLDFVGKPN